MSDVNAKDTSVSVLLLRLQEKEILIPKAMVADVLSWNEELFFPARVQTDAGKLGEYFWNDWRVPLVCFERLIRSKAHEEEMLKRKVVIIKAYQKGFESEHYAIQCRGFPKPLILSEQSLNNLDVEDDQEWLAYSISIGSRVLDIPDFASLESAIWTMHGQGSVEQTA